MTFELEKRALFQYNTQTQRKLHFDTLKESSLM